jgi:hypothetical protein
MTFKFARKVDDAIRKMNRTAKLLRRTAPQIVAKGEAGVIFAANECAKRRCDDNLQVLRCVDAPMVVHPSGQKRTQADLGEIAESVFHQNQKGELL